MTKVPVKIFFLMNIGTHMKEELFFHMELVSTL